MIGPGLYRLRRNVRNPSPDRRHRHDWRCLVEWEADELFHVKEYRTGVRELRRRGSYQHQTIRDDFDEEGRFARIALQLERAPEEPSDYLDRQGWEHLSGRVLDRLFAEKRFSLEDVVRVLGYELDGTPLPTGDEQEAAAAE